MENNDGLVQNSNAEPFDKEKWAKQKREERKVVYQMIDDAAVAAVSSGEKFQAFLNIQAQFDRYSASNALLIAHQCPDATQLADFAAWKNTGVHIKKGACAINLLEPGQEYTNQDGTVKTSYKVKKVFDVSQTTALQKHETLVSHDKKMLLNALVDHRPCEIEVSASGQQDLRSSGHGCGTAVSRTGTGNCKGPSETEKTDLLQPCLYGIFGCVCVVQEKSAVLRDVSF